ncbi:MAG: hypothetical protein ACKOXF_07095 [Chitinophagaceae bacterium]
MTNLLSNEDITVLGGPAQINVDLDFGPTGQRGSYWIVGNGNPNSQNTQIGQTPQIQDMYLNLDSENGEYLSVYQYQSGIGSTSWIKLVNLIPKIFSKNVTANFVNGIATINISLIDIVPSDIIGSIVATDFNIQHSVIDTGSPIASGLSISGIIIDNGLQVLSLEITASKLQQGAWENLSGQQSVHLFISLV